MRYAKIPDDVNPVMQGGFVKNESSVTDASDYDSEDERERKLMQLQVRYLDSQDSETLR